MDWDSIKAELRKPLDPAKVQPPPAGKYGSYVEGFHVITEANRIFGENGWSYQIMRLEMTCRHEAKDRNGNPQIRVGYLCTVRASVDSVIREGAAVGSGMAKPENEADAHESAVKEAETDALKRALRTLGYTFGLALYDKTQGHVQAPRPDPAIVRDRIRAAVAEKADEAALDALSDHRKTQEAMGGLPEPMRLEIVRAIADRRAELRAAAEVANLSA